ncbi:hypothetical protein ACFYSJ_32040 [Streptomyces sp. NPDC005248]|uniref:hypothetical protein n=1 Tax=unclassified Streptomyces TaxID=2593676 RepID=UPI003692D29E
MGRQIDIRDNLIARITEAERQGRLDEIEGLQVGLAGAENRLAQIDRRAHQRTTAGLGRPVTSSGEQRAPVRIRKNQTMG